MELCRRIINEHRILSLWWSASFWIARDSFNGELTVALSHGRRKRHAIILIKWSDWKLCATLAKISYHVLRVIFFVNGTPGRGEGERAYGKTGNRAESRSISTTRWSLLSAPTGTDTKIIPSSSAVYENSIVKHDLVRLALNVIVGELVTVLPVTECLSSPCALWLHLHGVPMRASTNDKRRLNITNKIKPRDEFGTQLRRSTEMLYELPRSYDTDKKSAYVY